MNERNASWKESFSAIENGSAGTHSRSVRERDLDNFMIEELTASRPFREWFLQRLRNHIDIPAYSRATVGKNPNREVASGQTDLGFVLWDNAGNEVAHILIEDKVALGFQPSQPERYAEEVAVARRRLGNRRAAAVLVAPRSNKAVLDNPNFDLSICLEEIVAHLRERRDSLSGIENPLTEELRDRLSARIDLLNALSEKRGYNGSWTPNPIPERLDFIAQYRALAAQLAPDFKTTDSSAGVKAKTILYTVPPIPGLNLRNIRHNFRSDVCLVLPHAGNAEKNIVKSGLLRTLTGAATDVSKKGTLLIRLSTVPLDATGEHFQKQMIEVEEAIKAVTRLYGWAKSNAAALARVLGTV